jgi:hypothetical protein
VFDLLIPDGPLHPELAIAGVGAGLLCAGVAGRRAALWLLLVPVAALLIVSERLGNVVLDGYSSHDEKMLVIAATVGAVAVAAIRPLRVSAAVALALGATAGVWAVVPDTEASLLVGAVIVGALALAPRDMATRLTAVLVALPVLAAVVGSIGRPGRFSPALAVAGAGAAGAICTVEIGRQLLLRRRVARVRTSR